MLTSTRLERARNRARLGRMVLGTLALVFTLAAIAPSCVVAPALAHGATPDGAASVAAAAPSAHPPIGDPACCDELRDASSEPRTLALPAGKLPEWPPLPAVLAVYVPRAARALASATSVAGGLPPGFASIPAYLRTLRLRV